MQPHPQREGKTPRTHKTGRSGKTTSSRNNQSTRRASPLKTRLTLLPELGLIWLAFFVVVFSKFEQEILVKTSHTKSGGRKQLHAKEDGKAAPPIKGEGGTQHRPKKGRRGEGNTLPTSCGPLFLLVGGAAFQPPSLNCSPHSPFRGRCWCSLFPFGRCHFFPSLSPPLLLSGAVVPSLLQTYWGSCCFLPPPLGGGAAPPPPTLLIHIHNINLRRTQTSKEEEESSATPQRGESNATQKERREQVTHQKNEVGKQQHPKWKWSGKQHTPRRKEKCSNTQRRLRLTPLVGAGVAFLLSSFGWKCFLLYALVLLSSLLLWVRCSFPLWGGVAFPSPPWVVLVQKKRTNRKTWWDAWEGGPVANPETLKLNYISET